MVLDISEKFAELQKMVQGHDLTITILLDRFDSVIEPLLSGSSEHLTLAIAASDAAVASADRVISSMSTWVAVLGIFLLLTGMVIPFLIHRHFRDQLDDVNGLITSALLPKDSAVKQQITEHLLADDEFKKSVMEYILKDDEFKGAVVKFVENMPRSNSISDLNINRTMDDVEALKDN